MTRETLSVKNKNVLEDTISKREKEKIHRMNHTFSRSFWNVFEFVEKIQLGSKGLNACKEITASLISYDEITSVFGAR